MNDTGEQPAAPAPRAKRGPYRKGIERRRQILDKTVEVFDERGYEHTSLRAIAESVGLTHAAVSRYFGSREQLFLEVLREADQRAEADLSVDGGLAAALNSADFVTRVPGLTALFNSMLARALESDNEGSRAYFVERYERLRGRIRLVLEHGRDIGVVREDVPLDVAASLLLAAMDGLSAQWLLDEKVDVKAGMSLLDHLLSAEPPEVPAPAAGAEDSAG
ncbi:TetR family transcriptional regulator [Streptomyces spiramenti]|uniref:TetR/AcrR family transcriptional regulator n=1 Tax=Streptomyces spiramenti TaxID=2720606 RepID=A0ABX1AL10_9ACTN|nr:TetR/AcrR family transcriptional regulator [Streptomyces spiramenti]